MHMHFQAGMFDLQLSAVLQDYVEVTVQLSADGEARNAHNLLADSWFWSMTCNVSTGGAQLMAGSTFFSKNGQTDALHLVFLVFTLCTILHDDKAKK